MVTRVNKFRASVATVAAGAMALGLAACSSSSSSQSGDDARDSVSITDNHGTYTISVPPTSVAVTDNRLFETLEDWGIELVAAPLSLIPSTITAYTSETVSVDLGSHREPDLEALVEADPELVINGQRFSGYYDEIVGYLPNATVIELDPRDEESFDQELIRQIEILGQIFQKEEEASQLISDFEDSIARLNAAYEALGSPSLTTLITSGGSINLSAPGTGRTFGEWYEILGWNAAVGSTEASTDDHEGDEVSVEAIAEADPEWILVMDRDAATSSSSEDDYVPANELIADSSALQNTTAVSEGQVVYMPSDTYTNESIQTYTEFFNSLAEKMEEAAAA